MQDLSIYPHFSSAEFKRRYRAVRRMMEENELGALVIYGNSGNVMRNEANVYYLTDYMDRHASSQAMLEVMRRRITSSLVG